MINKSFEIEVEINKSRIIQNIEYAQGKQGYINSYISNIDFKEIRLIDEQIEINRMPSGLNGFRAFGKILIQIQEKENGKSNLLVNILPFNNAFPLIIIIAVILMTLWTLLALLIGINEWDVLILYLGWGIASFSILISYKLNKLGLISYSRKIIKWIENSSH